MPTSLPLESPDRLTAAATTAMTLQDSKITGLVHIQPVSSASAVFLYAWQLHSPMKVVSR
ncbi:hypothetical protein [Pseudaminobacter salicylatoxidans]|uniref:hypothetical protein n=1 Tax=Pseudaminobacter salicylatoxidans TaxID=93369 RepID=UPI0012F6C247|nr:hypothetical protein [Pseudaminobacter salicylatoxidans]